MDWRDFREERSVLQGVEFNDGLGTAVPGVPEMVGVAVAGVPETVGVAVAGVPETVTVIVPVLVTVGVAVTVGVMVGVGVIVGGRGLLVRNAMMGSSTLFRTV
jgi:hypothetical protein